jgi:hypothetical protein
MSMGRSKWVGRLHTWEYCELVLGWSRDLESRRAFCMIERTCAEILFCILRPCSTIKCRELRSLRSLNYQSF